MTHTSKGELSDLNLTSGQWHYVENASDGYQDNHCSTRTIRGYANGSVEGVREQRIHVGRDGK